MNMGLNGPNWAPEAEGAGTGETPVPVETKEVGTATAEQDKSGQAVAAAEATPAATEQPKPAPAAPATPAVSKAPDWRDNEINRLRAMIEREKGKAPAAPATPATTGAIPTDPAQLDRLVAERAEALRAQQEFNIQCVSAAQAGREAYPDFTARVNELGSRFVNPQDADSVARYNSFLRDTIEATGNNPSAVAKVIYELAGDPNEAYRVMGLSAAARGAEIAKLANAQAAAVSAAPKPITPVGSHGVTHDAIRASDPERADKLSTAEWMARRNNEVNRKSA